MFREPAAIIVPIRENIMIAGHTVTLDAQTAAALIFNLLTSWIGTVTMAYLADVVSSALLNGKKFNGLLSFALFMLLTWFTDWTTRKITSGINATIPLLLTFSLISLGFAIVMYVDSILGMLNFGICDSLQPAISYCYGAGHIDRMKAVFKCVVIASMITSVIAFLFMLLVGPCVAVMFIKEGDMDLMNVSLTAIRIFSFSYLVGWIDMCFSSFFTALDRPARSLIVSLFGTLVFPILGLVILTSIWQLNGVWLMASVAATASSILTLILAKTLKIGSPNLSKKR